MAYVKFFRYFIEYKKRKFYFRRYLMIMRSHERIVERNIFRSEAHSALCNVIYCCASAVFKVDSAASLSETDMWILKIFMWKEKSLQSKYRTAMLIKCNIDRVTIVIQLIANPFSSQYHFKQLRLSDFIEPFVCLRMSFDWAAPNLRQN